MNQQGGAGAPGGGMSAMGGAVSQYWKKHIADSLLLRIFVHFLAALALLFQCLVILDCVPGAQGASSGTSRYYLVEFSAMNGTYSTRLRVGYTAMCVSLSGQSEHCAVTVGKDEDSSLRYLSTGTNDATSYSTLPPNAQLNPVLYDVASKLQEDVFVVLPAVPGAFLAIGCILLALYGMMNRPWVGPASSYRQTRRNRRLDIMRLAMIACIGLSIVFSLAVAVANSQMFAALKCATGHNQEGEPDVFTIGRGSSALALHWLAVIATIGFFIGIVQTHIQISSVRISVEPDDTAGTTGSHQYTPVGSTIEKASLLKSAEPMAMNPTGLQPQGPQGGQAGAGMRGGAMGARGRGGMVGARGGAMGARGGAMGSAMGARGGMAPRGRGM
ncbi:hypothetical protein LTR72_002041 [Exophiala xenobiotica]|nr:hypothetical protein LTR72_002041 [Exophiala xenobiotica]KAK5302407.1 hypothetical protein LTR14_000656 [Exophiala xenobiotica]KAK5317753.1 hypothetical protein LTR93_008394 [Exophiala xenobiotica]KAK5388233.1 hypothetical protein LTS13_001169 [Exophiala xenobiotica]KAK5398322.1 hypothetical protein LTR79_004604 [Exophiala xenobiotica]